MVIVIDFRRGAIPFSRLSLFWEPVLVSLLLVLSCRTMGEDVCRPRQTYRESVVLRIVWSFFAFFLRDCGSAAGTDPVPSAFRCLIATTSRRENYCTSGGKRWVTNLVTCSNVPQGLLYLVWEQLGGGVSDGRPVVAKCKGLFMPPILIVEKMDQIV